MHPTIRTEQLSEVLSSHTLFRCADDAEETCSRVGQVFRPHKMRVLGMQQRLSARMDHLPFAGMSLNRLSYGSSVSISSEPMGEFSMVLMPLAGGADIQCGHQQVYSTPDRPALVSVNQPLSMRWSSDSDMLILRIQQGALEAVCRELLGHELERPLEFELSMDLNDRNLRGWQSLIAFFATNSAFTEQASSTPFVSANFEHLLLGTLLQSHKHNFTLELERPSLPVSPIYVRRAEQYLADHCDQSVSVEDVARAVGVSVRTLYAGFQQYRQTSPMNALKEKRLERVRAELLGAVRDHTSITVADVALNYGFTHLGHFSSAYRKMFGELPSQTLKGKSKSGWPT